MHGVNKLYGDCSSWSLQVSGYFSQAGGEYEKWLLPALLFLEKRLVNPFSLTGVVWLLSRRKSPRAAIAHREYHVAAWPATTVMAPNIQLRWPVCPGVTILKTSSFPARMWKNHQVHQVTCGLSSTMTETFSLAVICPLVQLRKVRNEPQLPQRWPPHIFTLSTKNSKHETDVRLILINPHFSPVQWIVAHTHSLTPLTTSARLWTAHVSFPQNNPVLW